MTLDDQAELHEQFNRDIALKIRHRELPKIGKCYNCHEVVKQNANFCDADCRFDFERRTRK